MRRRNSSRRGKCVICAVLSDQSEILFSPEKTFLICFSNTSDTGLYYGLSGNMI